MGCIQILYRYYSVQKLVVSVLMFTRKVVQRVQVIKDKRKDGYTGDLCHEGEAKREGVCERERGTEKKRVFDITELIE